MLFFVENSLRCEGTFQQNNNSVYLINIDETPSFGLSGFEFTLVLAYMKLFFRKKGLHTLTDCTMRSS